jgi:tetratricopeptide (TPR) repeat protein
MSKARAAWLAAGAALLAFLPSLSNGFVDFDDERYLLASREHLGFALDQLKWMFTTTLSGPYQPFSWLSLALDFQLWGARAWGFHLTSALIHAANAALFFLVARELFFKAQPDDRDGALNWSALLAALIFALHPLRVESVAWASERRDVLCGFFYLASVLLYLKGRIKESFAAFLAALLSKGMAVTLPLTLLALDWYPLRRKAWAEKLPFFASSAVFGVVGVLAQDKPDQGRFPYPDLLGRIGQAAYGAVFYVGKTLLPVGLSPLYLRPREISLFAWPFLGCLALVAAAKLALIAVRKERPALATAGFCYLIALVPVLGLVPFGRQLAADRYTYLPCLPLALLAGAFARARWKRPNARLGGAIVSVGLLLLTWAQLPVWRDSASFWTRVVEVQPEQPMPRNSLAYALARKQPARAEAEYRKAIELDPSYELPHNNLGLLLAAEGKAAEAEAELRAAVALKPSYWEAHANLGLLYARENRLKEAEKSLEEAARLNPDAASIRKSLFLVNQALRKK